jgi:hypothetical protein
MLYVKEQSSGGLLSIETISYSVSYFLLSLTDFTENEKSLHYNFQLFSSVGCPMHSTWHITMERCVIFRFPRRKCMCSSRRFTPRAAGEGT